MMTLRGVKPRNDSGARTKLAAEAGAASGHRRAAGRRGRAALPILLVLLMPPAALMAQVAPPIDIEKSTNGHDADTPPGPSLTAGASITWTYVVKNTGSDPLENVTVTDDQGVSVSCPKTTLAVGESMTCTANGTATTGQYANLGEATGATAQGAEVGDTDPSHYFGQAAGGAIDIEKATNGLDADSPPGPALGAGETVQWTYVVTNTGSMGLGSIAVTDDQGVTVSCPQSALKPGESMTCTASGTVSEGQYANLGSASGIPDQTESPVTDSDPSHYFGEPATPSIDIEKATNGSDADTAPGPILTPGDPVNWTYVVTNTGNTTLSNVTVTDDRGVAVSCPKSSLAPGESMTCTASGTVQPRQYSNKGTVTAVPGQDRLSATLDEHQVADEDLSHYFGEQPAAITIEKATDGFDADSPPGPTLTTGDPVEWTYLVTNTGEETLMNVGVVDDQGVAVSCPKDTLAPGESMTCSARGTVIAGPYQNEGTASGRTAGLVDVTARDPSHYTGGEPVTCFDDTTATNTGIVEVCFTGGGPNCSFQTGEAVDVASVAPPPPGIDFPHGLVGFTVVNCEPGSTLQFTATFPQDLPMGTEYYKYGPNAADPDWYIVPATIAGNVATFSITDGGTGDNDLMADGKIDDPGGPGAAPVAPALPPAGLAILALALGLAAMWALRRRRA